MMGADQVINVISFCLYLAMMLLIGVLAYRQTHNLSDYILGGRRLGPWVAALSAGASDMSGWLLLGLPGLAYRAGAEAWWLALGLLLGTWLNWRYIARRLRIYSERAGDALTLPTYFERRFNDKTHALRILSALFILLFFMFYTSAGLVAGGKLFATVFGWDYHWAVLAGAAAILLYTVFGGFLAVAWTDLFQGLLMIAALLLVPMVALWQIDNWDEIASRLQASPVESFNPFVDRQGQGLSWLVILSSLAWGLGYFGQPHILARFKAIRWPGQLKQARHIAVSWTGLGLFAALAVGTIATQSVPGLSNADSEKVFMLLVNALFHPAIAGILLAAILAAIMSTADSQLLVASSVLAEDFYKALFRRGAKQKELVLVGRIAVLGVALVAIILAMDPESQVLELVAYAWAGFGAAFGPSLILSLYWPRMTRNGALAGILGGGLTVVIWKQFDQGVFALYEIVPGVVVATLLCLVVSRLGQAPDPMIVARHQALVDQGDGH